MRRDHFRKTKVLNFQSVKRERINRSRLILLRFRLKRWKTLLKRAKARSISGTKDVIHLSFPSTLGYKNSKTKVQDVIDHKS